MYGDRWFIRRLGVGCPGCEKEAGQGEKKAPQGRKVRKKVFEYVAVHFAYGQFSIREVNFISFDAGDLIAADKIAAMDADKFFGWQFLLQGAECGQHEVLFARQNDPGIVFHGFDVEDVL